MDENKAIEQLHRLWNDVEVRRTWVNGDSAVVEFRQAGATHLCLIDEDGTRLYRGSHRSWNKLAAGAAAFGATAVGALAIGSLTLGALAVGRAALGKVAVGKVSAGEVRIRKLVVEELELPEG